jgi:hypothetical protein
MPANSLRPTRNLQGVPVKQVTSGGNPDLVIAERRLAVAKLYLQGRSQYEIAAQLNTSQPTVSCDLVVIRKQWRESAVADFDAKMDEQLARIDLLEETAWRQFGESCKPAESKRVTVERAPRAELKTDDDEPLEEVPADAPPAQKLMIIKRNVERVSKGQTGNPAFLEKVAWCIETRLKLLGAFEKDNRQKAASVNVLNWGELAARADDSGPDELEQQIRSVKALPEHVEDAEVSEPAVKEPKKRSKK